MPTIKPLREDEATELKPVFEGLKKAYGRVPNIFAVMARRPAVLRAALPLFGAIMAEGAIPAKYKELAYLKTSLVNGCEY